MTQTQIRKILVFGNSGSGKSTLAKRLSQQDGLAHLDLDTIAWNATNTPSRKTIAESQNLLDGFIAQNSAWVIEGCYADLLELATKHVNEMIFLDLPVGVCAENARRRPWEPHKYKTKAEQDANLTMLIDWIQAYESRADTFSRIAHQALFDSFSGEKRRVTSNDQSRSSK